MIDTWDRYVDILINHLNKYSTEDLEHLRAMIEVELRERDLQNLSEKN
jgi:hypothetical protein